MTLSLEDITSSATHAALQAGNFLASSYGKHHQVSYKEGKHNIVTECDTAAEKLIIDFLKERFPNHSFLGEEKGLQHSDSPYLWIIDPLDGTVNFAHSIPHFCVSIACLYKGEVVVGVIFQPLSQELFIAQKEKGAFLNGNKMSVSNTSSLENAFLALSLPYNIHENPLNCIETLAKILKRGIPIRKLGSAALNLCYVASGAFDLFCAPLLHPWDFAAGKLIVEEAGGKVSHYNGADITEFSSNSLLATNGTLHKQILSEIL